MSNPWNPSWIHLLLLVLIVYEYVVAGQEDEALVLLNRNAALRRMTTTLPTAASSASTLPTVVWNRVSKTGSTSLLQMVASRTPCSIAPLDRDGVASFRVVSAKELRRVFALEFASPSPPPCVVAIGHFPFVAAEAVEGALPLYVSVLREPVARFASLYRHYARECGARGRDRFCLSAATSGAIEAWQQRHGEQPARRRGVGSLAYPPLAACVAWARATQRRPVAVCLETASRDAYQGDYFAAVGAAAAPPPSPERARGAPSYEALVRTYAVLGTIERCEETLVALAATLVEFQALAHLPSLCASVRKKVDRSAEARVPLERVLDAATMRYLRDDLALDYALYASANRFLDNATRARLS